MCNSRPTADKLALALALFYQHKIKITTSDGFKNNRLIYVQLPCRLGEWVQYYFSKPENLGSVVLFSSERDVRKLSYGLLESLLMQRLWVSLTKVY